MIQSLNHLLFVHSGKNHTVGYSNRKEDWFKWTCFHFPRNDFSKFLSMYFCFLGREWIGQYWFLQLTENWGLSSVVMGTTVRIWILHFQILKVTTLIPLPSIFTNSFLHHTHVYVFIYTRHAAKEYKVWKISTWYMGK